MKKTVTWILVADGARARILRNDGPGKGLQPAVDGEFSHSAPPTRELGSDRPGRTRESVGSTRHAMEPRIDWHRFEKEKFGRELAALLDGAAERNEFDRLVLVAPPRTLGDLRAALGGKARRRLRAELDKDLTRIPEQELPKHLDGVLAL